MHVAEAHASKAGHATVALAAEATEAAVRGHAVTRQTGAITISVADDRLADDDRLANAVAAVSMAGRAARAVRSTAVAHAVAVALDDGGGVRVALVTVAAMAVADGRSGFGVSDMLVDRCRFGDSSVAVALNGGFVNNMAVRGSRFTVRLGAVAVALGGRGNVGVTMGWSGVRVGFLTIRHRFMAAMGRSGVTGFTGAFRFFLDNVVVLGVGDFSLGDDRGRNIGVAVGGGGVRVALVAVAAMAVAAVTMAAVTMAAVAVAD